MAADISSDGGIGPTSPGGGATGQCIEDLWERHHSELFGYCFHIVDDVDTANDMVQITFCDAYRDWGRETIDNPRAWLFRLARDNCFDHLKRKSTREAQVADWESYMGVDTPVAGLNGKPLDFEPISIVEELELDASLVDALTSRQRHAVRLYYWEGLSVAEVAERLGIKKDSAWRLLNRARAALREHIDFDWQDREEALTPRQQPKDPFSDAKRRHRWYRDGDAGWRNHERVARGRLKRMTIEEHAENPMGAVRRVDAPTY